jgi:hypothetical protein
MRVEVLLRASQIPGRPYSDLSVWASAGAPGVRASPLRLLEHGRARAAHIVHKGVSWPSLSVAIAVPSRLRDSVPFHGTHC